MHKTWITVVLSACLVAAPLRADTGLSKNSAAGRDEVSAASTARKKGNAALGAKEVEKPAAAGYGAEIEQLRQMILEQAKQLEAQQQLMREQQEKLSALTEELRAARTAPAGEPLAKQPGIAAAANSEGADLEARVAKVEKDLAGEKKSFSEKMKGFGPFSFSGDVRLRYEPFFGGGAQTSPAPQDRHRERYRLRFNVNAKFNDEFSGGFSLASGDVGDPISTNNTETGFFTRKPFTVDKAFATYHPKWFTPFSVTAGKFAYTWQRTELTWDNDLNPEGASEQVMWDWKDKFLTHFGVVAFQMPVLEISGGPDSDVFGGQIQTGWKLGPRVKLAADAAYYDYRNPDRIAQNQNGGNGFTSSGTPTGFGGTFGFGGGGNTNNFGTINGNRIYASKFGILDAMLRADIDTGNARWPVTLIGNFAQNTRACENIAAFIAAELAAPKCDPHQRHGYWAEAQFGRNVDKGDFRFGYTFIRIERDAVVSAFSFSDLRQATNDANHRLEVYYQAYKNITVGFTGLIGRQLVTAQSVTPERWLKRWQFDMIYKF